MPKEQGPRKIQTTYYRGKELVKTNHAVHVNSASERCFNHMQLNHYEATTAEVFDSQVGTLHAVFRRSLAGDEIKTVFKREVKESYDDQAK